MQISKPFFKLLDLPCELEAAYYPRNFNPSYHTSIGYLTSLIVNGNKIENDMRVHHPENESQFDVAAVLENLSWTGQRTDSLNLYGTISPKIRASFLEALCSSNEKPKIEIEWIVYSYDHQEKKFFPYCYTKKPITFTFYHNPSLDRFVRSDKQPASYYFGIELTPPVDHEDQLLNVSFQPNGKVFEFPIRSKD